MPKRVEDWEMRLKAARGLEAWRKWAGRELERSLKAAGFVDSGNGRRFSHPTTSVVVYITRGGYLISWVNSDTDTIVETQRLSRDMEVPSVVDIARGLVWVCSNREPVSDE